MDRDSVALDELECLLCDSGTSEVVTLDESALRAACSAACLVAYPDASGATHEMDVRRLLGRLIEAYAQGDSASLDAARLAQHAPVYHIARLCAALRRLRGAT